MSLVTIKVVTPSNKALPQALVRLEAHLLFSFSSLCTLVSLAR